MDAAPIKLEGVRAYAIEGVNWFKRCEGERPPLVGGLVTVLVTVPGHGM
jgi:hypothetical protein